MKRFALIVISILAPTAVWAADADTAKQARPRLGQMTPAVAETQRTAAVDAINSMLRGELSAVETYNQALRKVGDEPEAAELRTIRDEHQDSANKLSAAVRKLGSVPTQDSGTWGAWAKTVEGTAKLFGDANALRALKQGEQHGLVEYQDALEDDETPAAVVDVIKDNKLIERQSEHIATLDRCIEKSSRS